MKSKKNKNEKVKSVEENDTIEFLNENTSANKKASKKDKRKEKKEKKKATKKEKKEEKKAIKKEKKSKHQKDRAAIVIIIVSTIFILLGILLALIGGGVITISFEKKPVLYLLSEKVQIGDYVDYDAGVWEEDVAIPNRSKAYTFGGYSLGVSRTLGVTCGYNDIENPGWRVFAVTDGAVTLIQSGISMCYYHGYGSGTNDKSVNILSGNAENINFDYFLDSKFGDSVKILSKEDIDFYYKDDTSWKQIDDELINVGNPYWLATKNGSYYMWYVTEGGTVATDHVGAYGVRVLVTLKKDAKTYGQNDDGVWTLDEEIVKDSKKGK